jgi:Leucine-rich repeat (LRR) protein
MSDPFLFVSHVSADRVAAVEIVAELERRGIRCWVAPRDVRPGHAYDDEISAAIESCRAMLLLFSDNCNESEYIRRELTVAGDCRKLVLPFRIDNAQPKHGLRVRLADLHWIDGLAAREQALDAVAQAVNRIPMKVDQPTTEKFANKNVDGHQERSCPSLSGSDAVNASGSTTIGDQAQTVDTAFLNSEACNMIKSGQRPPEPWRPFITELNLTATYDFHENKIDSVRDLTLLEGLTGLQILDIKGFEAVDLAPLFSLTGLRELYLKGRPIQDLAPFSRLTHLQTLDLSMSQIGDLAPLASLGDLLHLDVSSNRSLTDLTPLAGLEYLQILGLADTQVSDLTPLVALTGLEYLDLAATPVSDLRPLSGLRHLQTLDLRFAKVSNLAALARLTRLQRIDLYGTQVSNVAPLSELNNLQRLELQGTLVTDIAPLAKLVVGQLKISGLRKPLNPGYLFIRTELKDIIKNQRIGLG